MSKKVFNMAGGLHSAAAYAAFETRAYGNCVASLDSFVVSAGTGMAVSISIGDGIINGGNNSGKRIQIDAPETATVSPSSPSYNRIDSVVAYIDNAVTPTNTVIDNINNVLKFAVVAGTAAASPTAPSGATIQAAIGAGNPYMVIYDVTVPSNATNLTNATFTDRRNVITVIDASRLKDLTVTAAKLGANAVTAAKIDKTTFGLGNWSNSEVPTGYMYAGSPIYRKTINFGTLPNNANKDVPHGINNIARLLKIEGTVSDGSTQLPVSYAHSLSPFVFYIGVYSGVPSIRCHAATDRTAFTALVTLEYTKS